MTTRSVRPFFDAIDILCFSTCAVPACHNVCVTPFYPHSMICMLMIFVVTGFLSDCALAISVRDPAGAASE